MRTPHNIGATAPGLAAPERPLESDPECLAGAAGAAAVDPERATPTGQVGAAWDQHEKKADVSIIGDEGQLDKLKARTAAEFALLGFGLVELADGTFLATRWTCCRPLVDLAAARAFLRQVSGGIR